MNYRTYKFYARKQITAATTIVEDLRMADVISELIISLEYVNAAETTVAHPVKCLQKVEVIDGSEVLYSLDGYEADALDWYTRGGRFRSNFNNAKNGQIGVRLIGIPFGRYLFDPQYGLDPKKHANPQIRLTIDPAAGGNTGNTVYLTMYANLFDEKTVNPLGVLIAKEIKRWTIASTVHDYTDMPVDYPYRGLYIRAFADGTDAGSVISNVKLSEDQDKRVPVDLPALDILRCVQARYGECAESILANVPATAKSLYISPADRVSGVASVWAAAAATNSIAITGGGSGKLSVIASAALDAEIFVRGALPHAVLQVPFGDPNDPSDWYNVRSIGNLRLDVTGGASGTGYLYLQQLRPY